LFENELSDEDRIEPALNVDDELGERRRREIEKWKKCFERGEIPLLDCVRLL
jgi:hypothetical protein